MAGTQHKHMKQLREGYTPPKLSKEHFITPIKPQRAKELATHAFHFAMKIAAFLSLDRQGQDLKSKVEAWYQSKGYKYAKLDPSAVSSHDKQVEFGEDLSIELP